MRIETEYKSTKFDLFMEQFGNIYSFPKQLVMSFQQIINPDNEGHGLYFSIFAKKISGKNLSDSGEKNLCF